MPLRRSRRLLLLRSMPGSNNSNARYEIARTAYNTCWKQKGRTLLATVRGKKQKKIPLQSSLSLPPFSAETSPLWNLKTDLSNVKKIHDEMCKIVSVSLGLFLTFSFSSGATDSADSKIRDFQSLLMSRQFSPCLNIPVSLNNGHYYQVVENVLKETMRNCASGVSSGCPGCSECLGQLLDGPHKRKVKTCFYSIMSKMRSNAHRYKLDQLFKIHLCKILMEEFVKALDALSLDELNGYVLVNMRHRIQMRDFVSCFFL